MHRMLRKFNIYPIRVGDVKIYTKILSTTKQNNSDYENLKDKVELYKKLYELSVIVKKMDTKTKNTITGEEFEIKSKVLINATGPFADDLNRLTCQDTKHHLVLSKGIHLIVDKISKSKKTKNLNIFIIMILM